jgi:RNA polymerase sigma factor (sigma-70 family)
MVVPDASRLQTVSDQLPFAIDDTEAVDDAFRRWRRQNDADAERIVELWVYCYVCRYFLMKAAGNAFDRTAILDELITSTYEKIRDNRDSVREPGQFSSWVSVVCKNTFLNHVRCTRTAESINRERGPTLQAHDGTPTVRLQFAREAITEAIARLPEYLQTPARLYFLEGRGFEEISEVTDKAVSTVRTYKHKALRRLRDDDILRERIDDHRL